MRQTSVQKSWLCLEKYCLPPSSFHDLFCWEWISRIELASCIDLRKAWNSAYVISTMCTCICPLVSLTWKVASMKGVMRFWQCFEATATPTWKSIFTSVAPLIWGFCGTTSSLLSCLEPIKPAAIHSLAFKLSKVQDPRAEAVSSKESKLLDRQPRYMYSSPDIAFFTSVDPKSSSSPSKSCSIFWICNWVSVACSSDWQTWDTNLVRASGYVACKEFIDVIADENPCGAERQWILKASVFDEPIFCFKHSVVFGRRGCAIPAMLRRLKQRVNI